MCVISSWFFLARQFTTSLPSFVSESGGIGGERGHAKNCCPVCACVCVRECVSLPAKLCVYTWLTHRSAYTPYAEHPRAFNDSIMKRKGQLRDLAALLEKMREEKQIKGGIWDLRCLRPKG